ncbi:ArgP/LysG family DNA-binding transcriptional regulator [Auraticoccus sp. F435]|uniref:ArgP/LysG family DNA-binding transcriptional regulator n=1 Tax=Auraticoccus cholistanensis TaxID=2656650 RepID=A0A6A9UPI7_9ACTN|nr:ArgP/LysG family DNA-binding transcriptional regulator [Auraticoccus cholistanensis]
MDLDTGALTTLATVLRLGSLEAAARELHLTPSAVSQRLRALENRVGQVLVRRSRPVRPTEGGEVLLRLAAQIELLQAEALAELRAGSEPDGPPMELAVAVNADSLATWFLPVVADVQASQHVVLELLRDDERHSADLLRQGRVIAAVTSDPRPIQGCRTVPLGSLRYLAVAAPGWVRRWGAGSEVDLARAPMLVFDRRDSTQHAMLAARGWQGPVPPVTSVPSSADFERAVRLGIGWGMLPEPTISDALAEGELVALWPGDGHLDVALYWQHWRLGSTTTTALTRAVRDRAAQVLRPPG